jgi:hypothetical protein
MKSKFYLGCMIAMAILLLISNLLLIALHPLHMIGNIILLAMLVMFAILYGEKKQSEKYKYKEPNPYICGKNVAGTVYAAYPEMVPGLGWIGGT